MPPAPITRPTTAMMIVPTTPNSDIKVAFPDEGAMISPMETPAVLLQSTV